MDTSVRYNYTLPGITPEKQAVLDKSTSFRITKCSDKLYGEKEEVCKFIPFVGEFPIVPQAFQSGFLNSPREAWEFEKLPQSVQDIINEADKIKSLEIQFKEYLAKCNVSEDEFLKLSEEERGNQVESWMNYNGIPDGMLEIKNPYL